MSDDFWERTWRAIQDGAIEGTRRGTAKGMAKVTSDAIERAFSMDPHVIEVLDEPKGGGWLSTLLQLDGVKRIDGISVTPQGDFQAIVLWFDSAESRLAYLRDQD